MASIYTSWGFKHSPFITKPLTSDDAGLRLMVGRSDESQKIQKRISNYSKMTTVEGQNGIGKTSLVNVSAFSMFKDFLEGRSPELIIPCNRAFQITKDTDPAEFKTNVMIEVAQTLLALSKTYDLLPLLGQKRQIDKWINSPFIGSINASIQAFNVGIAGGNATAQNASDGFARSGINRQVEEWLVQIFENDGGVVCIIDNIEVLQETSIAKQKIETLRDVLFTIPGIRWVLAGSNGIVQGVLTSPRLDGILFKPIEVRGISDEYFDQLIESRIEEYKLPERTPYLPVSMKGMRLVFDTLNKNLRSFFGLIDEYCLYMEENELFPDTDADKDTRLKEWLLQHSADLFRTISSQFTARTKKVFEDAVAIDGVFSPSDFEHFQFASIPAFRPSVKTLEDLGLVTSIKDEQDQRRKTIMITDKGWLVAYYLEATK